MLNENLAYLFSNDIYNDEYISQKNMIHIYITKTVNVFLVIDSVYH